MHGVRTLSTIDTVIRMKTYVSRKLFDATSKYENSAQHSNEIRITSVAVSRQCSLQRYDEYIQAVSTTNGFISLFLMSSPSSSFNDECSIDVNLKSYHKTESSSNSNYFLTKLICVPSSCKKENNVDKNNDTNILSLNIVGGGNDGTIYVWSINRKIGEENGYKLPSSETSSLSHSLIYSNADIHNGSQINYLQTNRVGNKCISADKNGIFCLWKIKNMKKKNCQSRKDNATNYNISF